MGEAAAEALLFRDRYVGLPLHLTGVLFVAVATDPGRIPPLLRDALSPSAGYTDAEKQRIATAHLVVRRCAVVLSSRRQLLTRGYSLEPCVRRLVADIDALCRSVLRLRAEGLPVPGEMGRRRCARTHTAYPAPPGSTIRRTSTCTSPKRPS